ncbi:uncharacterized protein LOC133815253 [Humulus lupulus]|uniref:uncharacterized protein LOC133815253 n=1 Tax=Humulus lupulus TaxID=3486 RepID=UPI002B406606|nr:uncharacterized protein LOC133815253 [Humulus lupulus]
MASDSFCSVDVIDKLILKRRVHSDALRAVLIGGEVDDDDAKMREYVNWIKSYQPYRKKFEERMPFGLCNAPATFQQCMMDIFLDMVERSIEIFMDDFSVFGSSFDMCLGNLENVLNRC